MPTGTCLCGALRYELDGPISFLTHCHCSMCRKHHGASFATWAAAPIGGFRWRSGEDAVASYASSGQGERRFCRRCGSVAPSMMPAYGLAVVPAGNLEGDLGVEPQAHWFVGSKAPWDEITDRLPQHAEYPPEFGIGGVARPAVVAEPGVTRGSCLCGAVAFTLRGAPLRMVNCHCSRCRRGRSAAHATNLVFAPDALAFERGADRIREYRPPDAKYFAVAFCETCGGGVPRISAERGIAVVPAGALDTDPGLRPQMHIYVGSKAPWYRITDALPQFDTLPA